MRDRNSLLSNKSRSGLDSGLDVLELLARERKELSLTQIGLLVIPGTGCANGRDGDTVALAPPFIIGDAEIEEIVARLADALDSQRDAG